MIRLRRGRVLSASQARGGIQELIVAVAGEEERSPAYHFSGVMGPITPGDPVLLNTTAVGLGLGTGGAHFVVASLARSRWDPDPRGHIMKLRYTPYQLKVCAGEEEGSPHRPALDAFDGLRGVPVALAGVHSSIAPIAVAYKRTAGPNSRLVYVMTDGGALPIGLSRLVDALRQEGLVDATVTCGHAFGGDVEAVTLHSGLALARSALGADCIVVCMGPGVVGTGTKYGTTAIEQGIALDAAAVLGGTPIAALRISFADRRERHQVISHHSVTALGEVAQRVGWLAVPRLSDPDARTQLEAALDTSGLLERHRAVLEPVAPLARWLEESPVPLHTMGRSLSDDPAFFWAAGVCGIAAGRVARGEALGAWRPGTGGAG